MRSPPIVLLLLLLSAGTVKAVEGIDPAASGTAAALDAHGAVLDLLARADGPLMLGQNLGHASDPGSVADGYRRWFTGAAGTGGRVPLVCCVDYGWDRVEPGGIAAANAVLIGHWRRGGLVGVSFHPGNPCSGNGVRSTTGVDFDGLLTPGTAANRRWMTTLTSLGDGLQELDDAGVAVLFRPFHEPNGGWFWWCNDSMPGGGWTTPGQYRRLWAHLHDYLVRKRGLRNLIWIHAVNAELGPAVRPVTDFIPDPDRFDVVGIDLYSDRFDPGTLDANGGYGRLSALGKPLVISELGPARQRGGLDATAVLAAVRRHCPGVRLIAWWHSWGQDTPLIGGRQLMALPDNPGAREALSDPGVLSLPLGP